jgi:hypothetical protein
MEKPPSIEDGNEAERPNFTLIHLREAFDTNDKKQLRILIDYIQETIQRSDTMKCSPMTDEDLEILLKTGEGEIYVGTGTKGQRIYIRDGELRMPYSEGRDAELGRKYHLNFEHLFDIPTGEELRVKF